MCTVNNEDRRIDEYSSREIEITGRYIYIVEEFSYKSGKFFVVIRFDGDLEYLQLVIIPFFFFFYLIDKRIEGSQSVSND